LRFVWHLVSATATKKKMSGGDEDFIWLLKTLKNV
jgi:hypothetical protein